MVFEVDIDPRKFNEDENGHTPEEPLRYGFMLTQSKRGPLHDYVPSCIAHNDCLEIAIGNLVLVDGAPWLNEWQGKGLRWDSGVGGDSSPCRASPTRQRRGLAWPCRDLVHGRTAGVCCRGLKPTPQAAAHAPATQHLPVRACRTIEALVAVRRVPGQHIE